MRRRRYSEDEAEINITPMLDIVFIMLIFFIVTSSFVKEQGLEVSRPSNNPPEQVEQQGPIVVKIDSVSMISIQGRVVEPRVVEANLERQKAEKPEAALIVAAHPDADTEALVTVLNAAKAVAIENISVATTEDS